MVAYYHYIIKPLKMEISQEIIDSGVTDAARKAEPSEHTTVSKLCATSNLYADDIEVNTCEWVHNSWLQTRLEVDNIHLSY